VRVLVQSGAWRWILAIAFALVLGAGFWAYDVFWPEIRASWPQWKAKGAPWVQELLLWVEFLASVTLSVVTLCWLTALLFCLLAASLCLLALALQRLSGRFPREGWIARARDLLRRVLGHSRLTGTVLNALASAGSLSVLEWILKRPLDFWDIGIQVAIAVAIELIVLDVLFADGWIVRPAHR
jgi:hypothetical protein